MLCGFVDNTQFSLINNGFMVVFIPISPVRQLLIFF